MLRTEVAGLTLVALWLACAVVGVLAACLVLLGNPGNMGICGACFLRDSAGALGLFVGNGPRIFRPELVGLVFGACLLRIVTGKFEGRAGSHAGAKFVLGIWMGIGAMVFLGCPFRMLQRLGGGDLNALVGLGGFIAGVGVGRWFELRGYSAGKTAVVATPAGLPGILLAAAGLTLFLLGLLPFSGLADHVLPPHAFWACALGLSVIAGALLSLTGFCAVTAARQVFAGPRRMLVAAIALILGYALIAILNERWSPSFSNQPVAHSDHVWNALAMVLVGLTGVLAGGCPVRLVVLSGEGNSDAMVAAAGVLLGGALSHALGLASSPAGVTRMGQIAVGVGLAYGVLYASAVVCCGRTR